MMKKIVVLLVVVSVVGILGLVGCEKKVASSGEAIKATEVMKTVQEKVDYLIGQANGFYNSKQYQKAIDVASYILSNLDKESLQAKNIIEKAKEQLKKAAQTAVTDLKNTLTLPKQ